MDRPGLEKRRQAHPVPAVPRGVAAEEAAREAAEVAGVEIDMLVDMESLDAAERLFVDIWDPVNRQPLLTAHLMRALEHEGSYVAGAADARSPDRTLLGASVAFFGPPETRSLHSHVAGVSPTAQGRHIGYALKLHQYAWAQRHGLTTVTWTFDPLVRRNAYFNIAKLGARPTAYVEHFYGDMSDGINAGQGSDRLLMSWNLQPRLHQDRRHTAPAGSVAVLDEGRDGRPVAGTGPVAGDCPRLVRVPRDVETLRAADPVLARSWRAALRTALGGLLADGGRVSAFTRDGYYVVERGVVP